MFDIFAGLVEELAIRNKRNAYIVAKKSIRDLKKKAISN